MKPHLDLVPSAEIIGRYRYVELTLFALLGRRALACVDPEAMEVLAGAARAHAWRAKLFEEHLPVSLGIPGLDALTATPALALDAALADLESGADAELVDALGAVLYPAMTLAYRDHLAAAREVTDAPLARTLRRAIADLEFVLDELYSVAEFDAATPSARALALAVVFQSIGGPFGPRASTPSAVAPGQGS